MNYIYKQTEPALWTVGTYGPTGIWDAESDHSSPLAAADRAAYLNGGGKPAQAAPEAPQAFREWAIVELLGHRRLAGLITEVQLAGAGFLRLDIPETDRGPGRTQYIAPNSVYALHPVDEGTARRVATTCYPAPVQRWELPAAPDRGDDEDQVDLGRDPF